MWGIDPVSGLATIELNEDLNLFYRLQPSPPFICFLCFINDMQVPKLNADDHEANISQCDA